MNSVITLRPITPGDEGFLYRVYASTREEEMKLTNWDDRAKTEFLTMQFGFQDKYYRSTFPDAEYSIILCDGQAVGRLYLHRRDDEFRIIDIALLTEHRRAGIGGYLLREILAEADQAGKPVRIHVECNNPAMSLYLRLGFKKIADVTVYFLMERPVRGMTAQQEHQ